MENSDFVQKKWHMILFSNLIKNFVHLSSIREVFDFVLKNKFSATFFLSKTFFETLIRNFFAENVLK